MTPSYSKSKTPCANDLTHEAIELTVRRSVCSWLCVVAGSLWLVGPSHAQDSAARAEAGGHFDRGIELIQKHAYEEALLEFERAYALSSDDAVLYNLGMAQIAVNQPVEAVATLTRYLESASTHPSAEERARIEAELARQRARIGSLVLDIQPSRATCYVDGRAIAASAAPIQLAIGEHRIVARLAGYEAATHDVSIQPDQATTLTIALKALAKPALIQLRQAPEPRDDFSKVQSTLGWTVGGAAIVAGLAALTVYIVADQKFSSWKKANAELDTLIQAKTQNASGAPTATALQAKAQADDDRLKSVWALDSWAGALAISAGVLAVGSAVLLWTAPSNPASVDHAVAVRVRATGLGLRGEF
jgi:tetratricopeptide (TPR) repeat protein